jgi:outer membrane protein TolC
VEPEDTKLKDLLKERLVTVREIASAITTQYETGRVGFEQWYRAKQTALSAELDLCESDKQRIAGLEKSVTLAKECEKMADARFKAGQALPTEVLMAKAGRLEAEIALERVKAKAQDRPK